MRLLSIFLMQNTSMVSFDGGFVRQVDEVTASDSRLTVTSATQNRELTAMRYYGNVMTTTIWRLRVLHLQQYSRRLNLFVRFLFHVFTGIPPCVSIAQEKLKCTSPVSDFLNLNLSGSGLKSWNKFVIPSMAVDLSLFTLFVRNRITVTRINTVISRLTSDPANEFFG